jgi:hypothetical protein
MAPGPGWKFGRARGVGDLRRQPRPGGHVLGVVQALLQHADVLAQVPKIAAHQHEGGDGEGDVAGCGGSLRPGPDHRAGQARLQQHQQQVLAQPDIGEAVPGDHDRVAPGGGDLGQPLGFSGLGAEALDGRIGSHGVGQGPADLRIQRVGLQVAGPDIALGDQQVHSQIGDHHHQRDRAGQGLADQHGDRQPDQHDDPRPQPDGHRVADAVIAPHRAGQLAHRRAGEAVGVPVGREGLHLGEALVGHLLHVARGQRDPESHGDVADQGEGQIDADESAQRPPRLVVAARAAGHDVHQVARGVGQGEIKGDGQQGQAHAEAEQHRPPLPEPGHEAQHLAVRQGALAGAGFVFVLESVGHRREIVPYGLRVIPPDGWCDACAVRRRAAANAGTR